MNSLLLVLVSNNPYVRNFQRPEVVRTAFKMVHPQAVSKNAADLVNILAIGGQYANQRLYWDRHWTSIFGEGRSALFQTDSKHIIGTGSMPTDLCWHCRYHGRLISKEPNLWQRKTSKEVIMKQERKTALMHNDHHFATVFL